MSIKLVMPSNHLILCCPFLFLPSIFPSPRVFSNESALHFRWAQFWSFSFSISLQDWSPLEMTSWISLQSMGFSRVSSNTTVQKLQFFHAQLFFMVQLSHPYITIGKNLALTRCTLVSKVMSLLFNMMSRLVIAFLPRRKRLLISWLKSPFAFDFGAQENKVRHCFHYFLIYLHHEVMALNAVVLVF